jgi:chromosome segregation ATPase
MQGTMSRRAIFRHARLPNPDVPGILVVAMKNRIGVIILAVLSLALIIALITINKQASDQKQQDANSILLLSNRIEATVGQLEQQKQVNTTLESDMAGQKKMYEKALLDLTNNFTQVSATLDKTEADLKTSRQEVAKRDAKIADLETQNENLDKQAADLSSSITNLTGQISETQRKLAASEGDKAYLEKELKRMTAEKDALERQFNDLVVLKAQVSKLKEELSIARRIEWIREGLFASTDQKGAQKLMQGASATQLQAQAKPAPKPAYDLNVEVNADGSVKVIPPLTNSPAASPTPK